MIHQLTDRLQKAGIGLHRLTEADEQEILHLGGGADAVHAWLQAHSSGAAEPDAQLHLQLLSTPGMFWSNAEQAVRAASQERATPRQWLGMLRSAGGIKAGEDRWTGLADWLSSCPEKLLTRDDLLSYIDSHRVILHEDAFSAADNMDDLERLSQEFRSRIAAHNDSWRAGQDAIDSYCADMQELYGPDWLYLMSDDERWSLADLEESRDRYDASLCDQSQTAFDDMVTEYGYHFDNAFAFEDDRLVVVDEQAASRFLFEGIIDDVRLEYTTDGLDSFKELALWCENASPWHERDTIHFGPVGQGRCIGWVRFGTTRLQVPLTAEESLALLDAMPGPDAWVRQDGSRFVAGHDIYYPPGHESPYIRSPFIVHDTSRGCFLYKPLQGAEKPFPTLKAAVDAHNRAQLPQTRTRRVLVIDEVQSARHQAGRKDGYCMTSAQVGSLTAEYTRVMQRKAAFEQAMRDRYGSSTFGHYMTEAEQAELGGIEDSLHRLRETFEAERNRVPAAPFERNWHELLMKRMLRYAADGGFDRVAWTTGAQQNRRNDLTRVVQGVSRDADWQSDRYFKVRYNHNSETGFYVRPDGTIYDSTIGLDGRHIDEVFGFALSARVQSLAVGESLSGIDLTLGQKSLATFYDVRLTGFMAGYVSRWGSRVEQVRLPLLSQDGMDCSGGLLMHSVEVSPAMRESLVQGQPMFMRGPGGALYGFTVGSQVYLTERGMRPDTLVHEYTHVWAAAMQHGNPEGWRSVKDLLRATPLWSEVTSDSLYLNIRDNDDLVASEALARISGRVNAAKLEKMAGGAVPAMAASILERLRQALHTFWSWVGRHMFDIRSFRSVDEVTDRVLHDLLRGHRLEPGRVLASAPDAEVSRISHVAVFNGRGGVPHIRCKVDGVQQTGVPVKPQDLDSISDRSLLPVLAERYFAKALDLGITRTEALKR